MYLAHTTSLDQGEWGGADYARLITSASPPRILRPLCLPTHPSLIPPVHSTSGDALGIWICGCRLFFKGGSKGGYQGGSIRLKLEIPIFYSSQSQQSFESRLSIFLYRLSWPIMKRCALIEFMHYPKLDQSEFNQCTLGQEFHNVYFKTRSKMCLD